MTQSIIKSDQLDVLQELSKLLNTPLEEVKTFNELYHYSPHSIFYCISNDCEVMRLSIYNKNITYLEMNLICGLENLSHLYLNTNQIQNINPISKLNNLILLSLINNKIQDISSLSGLNNLIYLYLGKNQIEDIGSLLNLTNLSYLYIEQNNFSKNDLRYLKYPKKLIYCDMPNWKEKKKYFKREPLF
jgi:internalin A